ncbi:MAG: DUF4960 domain-containing protein [Muribaculaceae bacterium]|nr:DUF4960 domain-containing protein [Muribaculaceae bacterium]
MKIFTIASAIMLATSTLTAANPKIGMLIGYESSDNNNAQEAAAAKWFEQTYPDGVVITPSQLDKINASQLPAIWVHIDRLGIGMGYDKLPAEFNNPDVKKALTDYVKEGGSLYLSKFATQMVHELGRIDAAYAPGIFGDGDGGTGTDVWCLNAYLGSMQTYIPDADPTQIYDRTTHPIYEGMELWAAGSEKISDYPHPAYPMLGTEDGSAIHREDHNCMWDLNAYTWNADGKNTLEKFENQYDCVVLGTWGHVQDYCVAGIVEFMPTADIQGTIIANGLAACEWAPRTANNAYHANLTKLTENTLSYLASKATSGVAEIEKASTAEDAYYTLQGVKVANPTAGLYIRVADGKASKVLVK